MPTGNRGIQFLYYTQNLPSRSVAIAQVSTAVQSPAQFTDVNTTAYASGALTMTMLSSPYTVFTAADIQVSISITGSATYQFANQFFEMTDQIDSNNNPLYYQHALPSGVSQITVVDLNGNVISSGYVIRSLTRGSVTQSYLLHSFPSITNTIQPFVPYQVRYVDALGFSHLDILNYDHVIASDPFNASPSTYTSSTVVLTVNSSDTTYYVRWFAQNGYQILPPYGDVPNDPWFCRIRFNLTPAPPEWAIQVWTPQMPYILASWVPCSVLNDNLIQVERAPIYFAGGVYPDVLVYDSNNVLKYALAGKPGNGFLYPWRLNQFVDIDANTGVIELAVELDPTDIVYAFYSYQETDVVFRGLDLNPYTNPNMRNRVVEFYEKSNGEDPLHFIYYAVLNSDGTTFQTNDPSPTTGTNNQFGTLIVGQATSVGNFTFTDARQRGGGLAPLYQTLPQAVNFWDLGFWDGQPFPSGGSMIIYLPVSLQNTFTSQQVSEIIGSVIPMGTLPVIVYYDENGNEVAF